jgi:hypothetical protein
MLKLCEYIENSLSGPLFIFLKIQKGAELMYKTHLFGYIFTKSPGVPNFTRLT